jgi:inner membrane protein
LDNITHTLAGGLLGQMGLKRESRFAMAACLLGANAPDIDVFGPLVLPVDGIAFHRGPLHSVFAVPILAAAITGILWLVDKLFPGKDSARLFRPGALFIVAFLAVATHPFLDWLTTYAIALFSPVSWRWYSGNAIFIIDWVYWLVMAAGIALSWWRWRKGRANPGGPAQIAGLVLIGYIAFNLAESTTVEREATEQLRQRGIEATLVVASPPPLAFWDRAILWRSADQWGRGAYDPANGLRLDPGSQPLGLDNPALANAERSRRYVRSFLSWSRMPLVIERDGHTYLTDQRFYGPQRSRFIPGNVRAFFASHAFLVPLD